jgi:hypothetical protein
VAARKNVEEQHRLIRDAGLRVTGPRVQKPIQVPPLIRKLSTIAEWLMIHEESLRVALQTTPALRKLIRKPRGRYVIAREDLIAADLLLHDRRRQGHRAGAGKQTRGARARFQARSSLPGERPAPGGRPGGRSRRRQAGNA